MKVYLNGKLVPQSKACVSVFDHGLLYGDGVFEGIRTYNRRVFMLDEHVARLYRSARAIALDIPISQAAMSAAVVMTCNANRTWDGYVRVVVTRGVGTLGLNPYVCKKPQIIIIAGRIQLYPHELYEKGMSIITAGTVRNHPEAVNPCIKSLNYLNNILAKIEAINAGVMEAIMLNHNGHVAEATGDNVFAIQGDRLMTPPPSAGLLEGITRDVVITLAGQRGMTVMERDMTRYDLYTADEVFLTGTAAEIVPVVRIDRRGIGTGKPGRKTLELSTAFKEFARQQGTPLRGCT